jgi:hypothetical protein
MMFLTPCRDNGFSNPIWPERPKIRQPKGKASERSELAAALGTQPQTIEALKGRHTDMANETTNIPPVQG